MNAAFVEVACPTCQNQISIASSGRSQCPHCGQSVELEKSHPALIEEGPPIQRRDLNELFNEGGTRITRSQLMTRGMVVSVANISGVSTHTIQAKRGWPLFCLCLGIAFLFSMAWFLAALFIIPAVILLIVRRDKYATGHPFWWNRVQPCF
jgi:hypothetical protein